LSFFSGYDQTGPYAQRAGYDVIVFRGNNNLSFFSGYGQTGPYAQRAGYDVIVSGVGGLITITGPEVRYGHYCFTSFFSSKIQKYPVYWEV